MEVSFPVVRDVVLFGIAIYGAALSTFNWRQGVKRDRRQVSVSISTVTPVYGQRLGAPYAKLEAVNTGQRVVTIKTLTFETSDGGHIAPMQVDRFPGMADTRLPVSLSDGQSAHLLLPYSDIAEALMAHGRTRKVELTPVCVDSADNTYRGKPWEVDPHEWMQMGAA